MVDMKKTETLILSFQRKIKEKTVLVYYRISQTKISESNTNSFVSRLRI